MVKLSTTMSTLTRNVGRSCATASATSNKTRLILRSNVLSSVQDCGSIIREHLLARLLADIFSHQTERAQQGRPVLQMRGENSLHGLLGPLRHQYVQIRRTNVYLVGERAVIQQIRLPTFRQDPPGVAHQRRGGSQIEQFRRHEE